MWRPAFDPRLGSSRSAAYDKPCDLSQKFRSFVRTNQDGPPPGRPGGRPGRAPARPRGSRRRWPCRRRRRRRPACRSRPPSLRYRADRRQSGRRARDRARSRASAVRCSPAAFARMAPASQENAIKAPVFIRCKRVMAPMSSGWRSAIRSIIWPPTMPAAPAAPASAATSSQRTAGSPWVSGFARTSNAIVNKPVAGEDRGRLVEGLVAGRPAAAQIAVVHRRQIVVDQRIGVHHLDRRGDLKRACLAPPRRAARRPAPGAGAFACPGPTPNSASPRKPALRDRAALRAAARSAHR